MNNSDIERLRAALGNSEYMKNAINYIANDLVDNKIQLSCAEGEKCCKMCKTTKPFSDFYHSSSGKYQSYCKPCYNRLAYASKLHKKQLAN